MQTIECGQNKIRDHIKKGPSDFEADDIPICHKVQYTKATEELLQIIVVCIWI